MLSARYIHVGLFTQKSPSFYREQRPCSFYANPKMVSATQSVDISRRAARSRFRRNEGKKKRKKWKERQGPYIFSGNAREKTHDNRIKSTRSLSLSLVVACFMRNPRVVIVVSMKPRQVHRDTPACAFERRARPHVRSVTHAREGNRRIRSWNTSSISPEITSRWERKRLREWEGDRENDT